MAFNPPLGTTNADVFMGNVQRLDELVNGQPTTVPDRAGDPLYSWRGIHQNLIPLSRQYMTPEAAQADIANIMQGSTTFIRSQDNDYLAYEVMNVNGILQPTGRKQASQEFIEMVHNFAHATDMRTRGINTVSRKKKAIGYSVPARPAAILNQ